MNVHTSTIVQFDTKTVHLRRARSLLNLASCRSFFLQFVSKTIASAIVSLPFRYRAQSLALASSVSGASPSLSTSPLRRQNRWISLGARVQRSLCMQAKFPPLNTSTRYSSEEVRRAWRASLWILYGPLSKRSSWINRTKGQPGEDGLDLCLILLDLPKSRQGLGPGFPSGLHLLNRFPEVLMRALGCCCWWVRPTLSRDQCGHCFPCQQNGRVAGLSCGFQGHTTSWGGGGRR